MTDEAEVIVEQTDDILKGDDPEAYVAGVQESRDAEDERAHDEENLARARQGRPSLEDEEKEAEEARKSAEAEAKKAEKKDEAKS